MRSTTVLLTMLLASLTLSTTIVLAEETIYRWVDKDGVVHFSNRPEGHENAEIIDIKSERGTGPEADPEPSSPYDTNPEASYAKEQHEERVRARKLAAEKQREMDVLCKNNRERVATLEPVTRVLYEQEDGSVIRMDDNDRLEKIAESKAFIAENCDK